MTNVETLPTLILDAIPRGMEAALVATMAHFGCQAGTVHRLDADANLALVAHRNLPEAIVRIIQSVPVGKGIAGLAAERREPVSICNLQTDTSGQARPAAAGTGMEGSIAVPMLVNGELRGVFGIAKTQAHEWTDAEKALLLLIAQLVAERNP